MRIIPEIKATFGDTYFLGYKEKKIYDKEKNKMTDETEGYLCRISSSALQGQIDVLVPPTAAIQNIAFNQKVQMQGVVIDPYAKSSPGTSFAEVVLRCTAKAILDELPGKPVSSRIEGQKQQ